MFPSKGLGRVIEQVHTIFEIGGLVVGVLLAFIGLMIKDSINDVKLVAAATKLEIMTSQNRIETAVTAHVATDDVKHDDFERRITKIENTPNNSIHSSINK